MILPCGELKRQASGDESPCSLHFGKLEDTAGVLRPPNGVLTCIILMTPSHSSGHGAKNGAWNINYRIPFQRSAKVTLQHWTAPNSTCVIGAYIMKIPGQRWLGAWISGSPLFFVFEDWKHHMPTSRALSLVLLSKCPLIVAL